jgi:hypothetical protein
MSGVGGSPSIELLGRSEICSTSSTWRPSRRADEMILPPRQMAHPPAAAELNPNW